MGIKWVGVDRLERILTRTLPKVGVREMGSALFQDAEETMTVSKRDWVPVDLGVLRASGHVVPPQVSGTRVTVTLGYGGAASAYALIQHERMDFHHDVGRAKYLEGPVKQRAAGMGQRLARRMNLNPGL